MAGGRAPGTHLRQPLRLPLAPGPVDAGGRPDPALTDQRDQSLEQVWTALTGPKEAAHVAANHLRTLQRLFPE